VAVVLEPRFAVAGVTIALVTVTARSMRRSGPRRAIGTDSISVRDEPAGSRPSRQDGEPPRLVPRRRELAFEDLTEVGDDEVGAASA
jgi:hypothetical protein